MKKKIILLLMVIGLASQVNGQETSEDKSIISEVPYFPGCDDLQTKYQKKPNPKRKMKLENCRNMEMLKFIYLNVQYPKTARSKGIEGDVFLRFVISKKGDISDVEVIKGVTTELNKEAVRVINLMPFFIPAKDKNGNPVESIMNMPIKFRL